MVVLVVVPAVWLVLAAGACGSTPGARMQQAQQGRARMLMPAQVEPRTKYQGEVRTARVRVYAEAQYRAQNLRWAERVADQLDSANQYLVPMYGLRLEVVEARPWERTGTTTGTPTGTTDELGAMLAELESLDSAGDVDWVIGMVTALSASTPVFHQLGVARPLGRHIILRGLDDLAERKAIEQALDRLEEAERQDLLDARKEHLQTMVLLHEWAHTLGAMHVSAPGALMATSYSTDISGFSIEEDALIRAVLEARILPPAQRSQAREAQVLRRHLAANRWSGWIPAELTELEQLLATYESQDSAAQAPAADTGAGTGAAGAAGADAGTGTAGIPGEARAQHQRVLTLARQGKTEAALAELDALLSAYPAHTELRLMACSLWLAKEGPGDTATRHCLRVAALDPDNADGELALAAACARAGQVARAGQILAGLRERMATLRKNQDRVFAALAAMYQSMNAVTWAEQTVAAAPASVDTRALAAWAQSVRRRYGLPPTASRHGITPEREGEYVAMVRAILDRVYARDHAQAQAAARQASRAFPRAPGIHGALCDLEVRAGRYGAARGHCQSALAGYAQASWPRYLLGIIELHDRRTAAGIRHLEQAIALDPELRQAYHALDKAYDRQRNASAQERLRQAYLERFGAPMPQ